MKFEFGVMSNKWTLEAEDTTIAYIAMALFIGKNVPVAVYSPQKDSFMPKVILESNNYSSKREKLEECLKTIEKFGG